MVAQAKYNQAVLLDEFTFCFDDRIVAAGRASASKRGGRAHRPRANRKWARRSAIRFAFAFTACLSTSIVAIAVVAIPFTTIEGSPALNPSGPVDRPIAAKFRLYAPYHGRCQE